MGSEPSEETGALAARPPDEAGPGGPSEGSGPQEAVPGDTSWRMLHGASVAVNLIPRTWAFVRQAWPLLLFVVVGGAQPGPTSLFDLSILGLFFAMTVGQTIVHYLTLRYRVVEGRLEIRSGLLNRQARVISPEKVQNVELVRNLFHRMSGLVEVRIETASGSEVEGLLSALDEAEARRLVRLLKRRRGPVAATAEEEAAREASLPVVVTHDTQDLLWFGATNTRLGAAAAGLFVLYEYASRYDPDAAVRTSEALGWLGAAAAGLALVTGAWVLGVVGAVMRHHGFRMVLDDDRLVASEGLLTQRRVELARHKVQRVSVVAPWLRRALGFASVEMESAAVSAGQGGMRRAVALIPVVVDDDLDEVVRQALPQLDLSVVDAPLRPPSPRALTRALVRAAIQGAVITALAVWLLGPWGALGLLAAPALAGLAWLDHRHQGWLVTAEAVVSRRGVLRRTTTVVMRRKLQAFYVQQGLLLRNYDLGQGVLRVAGSSVALPLLDHDEAYALMTTLSSRTAHRALPSADGGADGDGAAGAVGAPAAEEAVPAVVPEGLAPDDLPTDEVADLPDDVALGVPDGGSLGLGGAPGGPVRRAGLGDPVALDHVVEQGDPGGEHGDEGDGQGHGAHQPGGGEGQSPGAEAGADEVAPGRGAVEQGEGGQGDAPEEERGGGAG